MIKLEKLVRDEFVYPRRQLSQKTIEAYAESLKVDAVFPPILVQKVKKEVNGKEKEEIIILDGVHRVEAYKVFNKENGIKDSEILAEDWKGEILNYEENKIELKLEASKRNIEHGDRLTNGDKEAVAQSIAESDPEQSWTEEEIAKYLGVGRVTVHDWISSTRARQKAKKESLIYRLDFLNWTQEEIGKMVGLDQSVISRIMQNVDFDKTHNEMQAHLKQGRDDSWLAEHYGFDLQLVWAILLRGKNDLERFRLFGRKDLGNDQPKLSEYWKFNKGDPRLGKQDYPGRIWGQEVMNIIYRYSKEEDLIVDPMAGGGVVVDMCLIMNRKCRAYDIAPIRKDILQNDIRKGFPEKAEKCDLITVDPPYYKKLEDQYNCPDFTKDKPIFLANMEKLARDSHQILKKGKYFALLYGQWLDYENELESVLVFDLEKLFEKAGFREVLKIQSPLIFDVQYAAHDVDRAKKKDPWQILPISRDWCIFKKI